MIVNEFVNYNHGICQNLYFISGPLSWHSGMLTPTELLLPIKPGKVPSKPETFPSILSGRRLGSQARGKLVMVVNRVVNEMLCVRFRIIHYPLGSFLLWLKIFILLKRGFKLCMCFDYANFSLFSHKFSRQYLLLLKKNGKSKNC